MKFVNFYVYTKNGVYRFSTKEEAKEFASKNNGFVNYKPIKSLLV